MPDEEIWNDFFNVDLILSELQINSKINDIAEIGFGYGTFTLPAAKLIKGKLFAFDIDQDMLEIVEKKINDSGISNVIPEKRDIISQTTGLGNNSVDYVMLFNILHHDNPDDFFHEACRILKLNGKIGIIHWRSDIITPRGPDLSIRPEPQQILNWIDKEKFSVTKGPIIFEPYHFGMIIKKIKD